MSNIEDKRNEFSRKLDAKIEEHRQRIKQDLSQIRQSDKQPNEPVKPGPGTENYRLGEKSKDNPPPIPPPLPSNYREQVNITESDDLKRLDQAFFNKFNLSRYYQVEKLSYETILCEHLDEFYKPYFMDQDISDTERQKKLEDQVKKADHLYKTEGKGALGFNIPAMGCYLNGWIIAQKYNIQPGEVKNHQKAMEEVTGIAAHEKLGHGFINMYSTLGQLNTKLGFTKLRIAKDFGIAPSQDAVSLLRFQQSELLFTHSVFLEEGWAKWIEHYMKGYLQQPVGEKYSIDSLQSKFFKLPSEIKKCLRENLEIVLSENTDNKDPDQELLREQELLRAILALADLDLKYYYKLYSALGLPLRYILGEMICDKCVDNIGEMCMPLAVMVAANVSFDPAQIGVIDLKNLLETKPRLNPNVRLVLISKLKLKKRNDIDEFIERVSSDLSLIISPELKK